MGILWNFYKAVDKQLVLAGRFREVRVMVGEGRFVILQEK